MGKKDRRGGRMSEEARRTMISEAQESEAARQIRAKRELEEAKEAACEVATEVVEEILSPGVAIEAEDWDVVVARSEGGESGPYPILVANAEIEGICVIVTWAGYVSLTDNITRLAASTWITPSPVEEGEDMSGFGGRQYLTRESFGRALSRQQLPQSLLS